MSPTPRTYRMLTGAIGAIALATLAASPSTAAAAEGRYVALGDSMPAGPLIPFPTGPLGCVRSTNNYPHELAERLDIKLKDVTCSGATTEDMTERQSVPINGSVAPQFDALNDDTTLVTLTIGGNDAGLVGIATGCVRLDPNATPCKDDYVHDGKNEVEEKIDDEVAPKIARVIAEIRAEAPKARLMVTGYGLYVKPGGCWPKEPVLAVDADFLQGSVDYLNETIEKQAAAHGATYIDVRTPSEGHDACQEPKQKWIEGFVPTSPAAPLHPNRRGERNYARIIAESMESAESIT